MGTKEFRTCSAHSVGVDFGTVSGPRRLLGIGVTSIPSPSESSWLISRSAFKSLATRFRLWRQVDFTHLPLEDLMLFALKVLLNSIKGVISAMAFLRFLLNDEDLELVRVKSSCIIWIRNKAKLYVNFKHGNLVSLGSKKHYLLSNDMIWNFHVGEGSKYRCWQKYSMDKSNDVISNNEIQISILKLQICNRWVDLRRSKNILEKSLVFKIQPGGYFQSSLLPKDIESCPSSWE